MTKRQLLKFKFLRNNNHKKYKFDFVIHPTSVYQSRKKSRHFGSLDLEVEVKSLNNLLNRNKIKIIRTRDSTRMVSVRIIKWKPFYLTKVKDLRNCGKLFKYYRLLTKSLLGFWYYVKSVSKNEFRHFLVFLHGVWRGLS